MLNNEHEAFHLPGELKRLATDACVAAVLRAYNALATRFSRAPTKDISRALELLTLTSKIFMKLLFGACCAIAAVCAAWLAREFSLMEDKLALLMADNLNLEEALLAARTISERCLVRYSIWFLYFTSRQWDMLATLQLLANVSVSPQRIP